MNKKPNTRRALVLSVLSLLLCTSLLIGSTFAWFTDTASTAVNTIQSGTLDIDFQMLVDSKWVSASGEKLSFVDKDGKPAEFLVEPGGTYQLAPVKLVNGGNLALQYKMLINGLAGDVELANVMEVKLNGATLTKPDGSAVTLADLTAEDDGAAHGVLLPAGKTLPDGADANYVKIGDTGEMVISLHMAESANNDYQGMTLSGIGLTAYATQYTYEYDSFGNTYDENAEYKEPIVVESAQAAVTAMENAKPGDVIAPSGAIGALEVPAAANGITLDMSSADTDKITVAEGAKDITFTGLSIDSNSENKWVIDLNNDTADYGTITIKDSTILAGTGVNGLIDGSYNTNLVVENCTFDGANRALYDNYRGWQSIVIENCTFRNMGTGILFMGNNNLEPRQDIHSVTVNNCTFENITKNYLIKCGALAESGSTVTFTNNTIINCPNITTGLEMISSNWPVTFTGEITYVISGNTRDGQPFTPAV